jgi:hypothetical protein
VLLLTKQDLTSEKALHDAVHSKCDRLTEEFYELRELVAIGPYGNKEECVKYDVKEGRFLSTIRAEDSKAR